MWLQGPVQRQDPPEELRAHLIGFSCLVGGEGAAHGEIDDGVILAEFDHVNRFKGPEMTEWYRHGDADV